MGGGLENVFLGKDCVLVRKQSLVLPKVSLENQ